MNIEQIEPDAIDDAFTVAAEAMKLANVMMYCQHLSGATADDKFRQIALKAGELALSSILFASAQIEKPTLH